MADTSYIKGRIVGLNELIKVLKDVTERKEEMGPNDIIEVITAHISQQMEDIMSEFMEAKVAPEHVPKLEEIKEKHEETKKVIEEKEKPEEKVEEQSKSVDDLLKDLEVIKSEGKKE